MWGIACAIQCEHLHVMDCEMWLHIRRDFDKIQLWVHGFIRSHQYPTIFSALITELMLTDSLATVMFRRFSGKEQGCGLLLLCRIRIQRGVRLCFYRQCYWNCCGMWSWAFLKEIEYSQLYICIFKERFFSSVPACRATLVVWHHPNLNSSEPFHSSAVLFLVIWGYRLFLK